MKRLMTGMALLAMASAAPAQSKANDEILAAEKAWADSYQSCNVAVMGSLLSDDLSLIQHVSGATMTKEQFLKSVAACSMEVVQNNARRVRVYGDAATVQGTSTYTIKNVAEPISVIYTRVWVKKGGAWQIVNHQSTGLPAAKPATGGK